MSGQINLKAASLGGQVTLTPEDTASNVVVTVPAGTSTLVTNATLPAQLNATGSAPIYACRAWVNFNGTGTVAIRASGNVSSITDLGVGQYGINFTTAMTDANYCVVFTASYISGTGSGVPLIQKSGYTASQTRVEVAIGTTNYDSEQCHVAIFR